MVLIQPIGCPFKCTAFNGVLISKMAIVLLGVHAIAADGCSFDFFHCPWIALLAVLSYFAIIDLTEEVLLSQIVQVIIPVSVALKAAVHIVFREQQVVCNEV